MRFSALWQRHGVLLAFAVLFLISAIWKPDVFLQPENLRNILNQNAAVGILAIGMTLVIVAGGIDLSVGSLMALAAAVGVEAFNRSWAGGSPETMPAVVFCVACLLVGLALGLINGALVAYGRVAPFIATLVGLVAFRSLCLALADGGEVRSGSLTALPTLGAGGIPTPLQAGNQPIVITYGILLFLASAAAAHFLLNRTKLGRYAIAVGSNERAAHYAAIPVKSVQLRIYALMGLFCGLAAIVSASRMNSVSSSSMGLYFELDAIAAAVIGGARLSGGYGRVWGTVIGVLILGVITNMLVVAGVSVYWQGVVKGLVILAAVLLQRGVGLKPRRSG